MLYGKETFKIIPVLRYCVQVNQILSLFFFFCPQDAFPKGEIFLGHKEKGFAVRDGLPPGMKEQGHCFTLRTPDRHFHFSAEADEDRQKWMEILKEVITQPLSPQDSSSMFRATTK